MKKLNMMLIAVLFIFTVAGCASKQKTTMSSDSVQPGNNIQTVSVASFKCSDPLIAQNIKSKIVEALLADYSVVIGAGADASVTGVISLSHNTVSEVKAKITQGNKVLTTLVVETGESDTTAEVVGKKMGDKINGYLSR